MAEALERLVSDNDTRLRFAENSGHVLRQLSDVRADYRAIFGEEPPDPGAVTLSIDSNDTHSRAESLIGPIRFSPS